MEKRNRLSLCECVVVYFLVHGTTFNRLYEVESSLLSLHLINPFAISAVPAIEYFEGYHKHCLSHPEKIIWPRQ